MALPDNRISDPSVEGDWILAEVRMSSISDILDFEDGGIAINNPSEGLLFQVWRGRLVGGITVPQIILDVPSNPGAGETIIYAASNITEFSFTFDRNMAPVIVFIQDNEAKIRWYDSAEEDYVIDNIGPGIHSPRAFHDDKRSMQTESSDVLISYLRYGNLYYRQQRDRYTVEYLLAENIGGTILRVGMTDKMRVQFLIT